LEITFCFDKAKLTVKEILAAVEKAGYKASEDAEYDLTYSMIM
jgi:hypothetical protein